MLLCFGLAACGGVTAAETVELGDHPEVADTVLDEDFFHCRIQPEVITRYRCVEGQAGDGDGCHASRSALRMVLVPDKPRCADGRLLGSPSPESVTNLERVRAFISIDAESSPLYLRPLGIDSHPRRIFAAGDAPAELLRSWLDSGAQ